nr:calmodulin-like protein 9 [Ipomoea batatas]
MVEPVSISIIVIVAAVAAALKSTAGVVKVVSEISKKKSKAEKQNAEAAKGSAEKNSKKKLKAENNPSEQNAEAVAEISINVSNTNNFFNLLLCVCGNESVPMMIPGSIPVFDGNDYETWRHMMKAFLISYDLWDSVENGCDKAKALKNDRKDFLAMLLIMQAVDPSIRRYTVYANTSKEAWDAIQNYYLYNCQDKSRKSYLTNIIADDGIGIARVAIGIILAAIAIFMYENGQQRPSEPSVPWASGPIIPNIEVPSGLPKAPIPTSRTDLAPSRRHGSRAQLPDQAHTMRLRHMTQGTGEQFHALTTDDVESAPKISFVLNYISSEYGRIKTLVKKKQTELRHSAIHTI